MKSKHTHLAIPCLLSKFTVIYGKSPSRDNDITSGRVCVTLYSSNPTTKIYCLTESIFIKIYFYYIQMQPNVYSIDLCKMF